MAMTAVGMDAGFDGGAAAWVLEHLGCVATARSEDAALAAVPDRIRSYRSWAGEVGLTSAGAIVSVAFRSTTAIAGWPAPAPADDIGTALHIDWASADL